MAEDQAPSRPARRRRTESLRDSQNRVLELAVQNRPLGDVLDALVQIIENESDGEVLGSILLLDEDGEHLRHGAAPSLAEAYIEAIDGIAIGPAVGSCGTAAYSRKPVYVADIGNDPLWQDFRELAIAHGLRACWSTPILGRTGGVLGTFAMYYRTPREPRPDDLRLVDYVTRTASLIIDRHRAAQGLKEQSEEFQTLADNIPLLAWMAYADGHIYWYNRRWYEYTGTTPESQEGWGWESVHDPQLLPSIAAEWKTSLETGQAFDMVFPLRGADGQYRTFLTRAVPIRDEQGNVVRWFGTNVDITDQKRAEEQLRQESENLETLNRTGSAIAGELDLEKVVQLVTDAGVRLTGAQFGAFFYNVIDDSGESYTLYTLSGAPRSAFENFPMPRNTAVFGPTFAGEGVVRSGNILADPRYGKHEPYFGMPKGHLPVVSYLAVPVTGRTGEVIGGLFFGHPSPDRFEDRHERLMEGIAAQAAIAIDNARLFRGAQREIDRRVKAEQALTALNETLESRVAEEIERRSRAEETLRQTQKMETVGQLSGGIAHDFNNLLQVIHGNLSILDRSLPVDDAKLRRSVANALSGTERAATLTKRLLAFSRREALDPRPIDVNRLILDMTELLHRTLGETIVIRTHLDPQLPAAFVDGNQLENAILNLAINARDAMPRGGELDICTALKDLDSNYVRSHPDAEPGRYIEVIVRDVGEGMSELVLARAVEPFFSTKEVGQGTGLGLSMVYGFVRQSGGHLEIKSRENEGTTIHLYLPFSEASASAPGGQLTEDLPRGHGERILLCEDDQDVRLFSMETLQDLGYSVIEARDANSALQALRDHGPVALLFTDVVLPGGKTGADLAREARLIQPDLMVLFTTGYARTALDQEQKSAERIELLLKPFGVDDLAKRLKKMLDSADGAPGPTRTDTP
jgi:PAS domain S-box-containing protein